MIGKQFVFERLVISFREHAFLFKNGQDTQWLKEKKPHIN
jgi:hypothetical protein